MNNPARAIVAFAIGPFLFIAFLASMLVVAFFQLSKTLARKPTSRISIRH